MSAPPTPSPVDQVFTPGLRVWGGEGIRVVRDFGSLATPSGALLLGDPLELATAPRLPSGAGPIAVHLATVRMSGEHELAAVRVVLGPGEVRRWKKTRKVCAIDSATACLCDAGLGEALRDEAVRRRFTKRWERFAALSLSAQRASFGGQLVDLFHVCDDGRYPLWEGLDEGGHVAAVAVIWSRHGLDTAP